MKKENMTMRKFYFKKKKDLFPIEWVIQQRLKMQTNQKILTEEFRIPLNIIFKPEILDFYDTWDEEKKNKFIEIVGGKINFNRTKSFLESKKVKV